MLQNTLSRAQQCILTLLALFFINSRILSFCYILRRLVVECKLFTIGFNVFCFHSNHNSSQMYDFIGTMCQGVGGRKDTGRCAPLRKPVVLVRPTHTYILQSNAPKYLVTCTTMYSYPTGTIFYKLSYFIILLHT